MTLHISLFNQHPPPLYPGVATLTCGSRSSCRWGHRLIHKQLYPGYCPTVDRIGKFVCSHGPG
jgi:hypothetical protein